MIYTMDEFKEVDIELKKIVIDIMDWFYSDQCHENYTSEELADLYIKDLNDIHTD